MGIDALWKQDVEVIEVAHSSGSEIGRAHV